MPTLYLTETPALVRRESQDTLLVEIPEKPGHNGAKGSPARKEPLPLAKIDEVVVLGEAILTTAALHLLLERGVEITYLDQYGQFKGRLSPAGSKNAVLRLAQYRAHHDMTRRSELARRFVMGKLSNQRTLLQRYHRKHAGADMSQAIEQMGQVLRQLAALPIKPAPTAPPLASGDHAVAGTSLEAMLGMEGAGSAAYFRCFGQFLSDQRQWPFPGRVKRPPTDPVNALLSLGYTVLTSKVASAVHLVGFDPGVGYLHSAFYGRPALALDLVEEFRPVIVDSVVLTLLNNRMLTREDFVAELGAYRLKDGRHQIFFLQLEERLNEEVQHPTFGYKTTYRRCLELQARLLAKVLTGEIDEYPPLLVK
jgi:CRISPR-associated protein Cas1